MKVLIGVDPHKGSHTAVAIDGEEVPLGQFKVRVTRAQCQQLLAWAEVFPDRRWVIELAGGLGYPLAQQLVGAGEDVVDVPPTLPARPRRRVGGPGGQPGTTLTSSVTGSHPDQPALRISRSRTQPRPCAPNDRGRSHAPGTGPKQAP